RSRPLRCADATADYSTADREKEEASAETHEAKSRLTKDNGALLFRLHELLLRFAPVDDKGVVVAQLRPWTGRNFAGLDKFPIGHIGLLEAEVIANGRRNIESGAPV